MQVLAATLNTAVTQESGWENESRVLERAFFALSLESELFGIRQLFPAKVAPLLSLHNKRLLIGDHAHSLVSWAVSNNHDFITIRL
jgi:hypothetical protein